MKQKENEVKNIEKDFFQASPFSVALIDKNYTIVNANKNFEDVFGEWQSRYCHQVCKGINDICSHCKVDIVFNKAKLEISEEVGIDRNGNNYHYIVYFTPVLNESGDVQYVNEIIIDAKKSSKWQKELNILFEHNPSSIAIIDRDFRILRSNSKFKELFGSKHNDFCYKMIKGRKKVCRICSVAKCFDSNEEIISNEVASDINGNEVRYLAQVIPFSFDKDGKLDQVLVFYTDLTEMNNMEEKIRQQHDYYSSILNNTNDSIIALDKRGKVQIFNSSARELMNWEYSRKPGIEKIKSMLPEEFFHENGSDEIISNSLQTKVKDKSDNEIKVNFSAIKLRNKKDELGKAAIFRDISEEEECEKHKIHYERTIAVKESCQILENRCQSFISNFESFSKTLEKENPEIKSQIENFLTDMKAYSELLDLSLPEVREVLANQVLSNIREEFTEDENKRLKLKLDPEMKPILLNPQMLKVAVTILLKDMLDSSNNCSLSIKDKTDSILEFTFEISGHDAHKFKSKEFNFLKIRKIALDHNGQWEIFRDTDDYWKLILRLNRQRLFLIAKEFYKNDGV